MGQRGPITAEKGLRRASPALVFLQLVPEGGIKGEFGSVQGSLDRKEEQSFACWVVETGLLAGAATGVEQLDPQRASNARIRYCLGTKPEGKGRRRHLTWKTWDGPILSYICKFKRQRCTYGGTSSGWGGKNYAVEAVLPLQCPSWLSWDPAHFYSLHHCMALKVLVSGKLYIKSRKPSTWVQLSCACVGPGVEGKGGRTQPLYFLWSRARLQTVLANAKIRAASGLF